MTSPLPRNAAVWFEIPVADMDRAKRFYAAVVGRPLNDETASPAPMANFPYAGPGGVSGHIHPGKPAAPGTGPVIHLAVDAVEAAMERVTQAGGRVVSPVVAIPDGRFAYCLDPDGNGFGVFSAA